MRALTVSAGHAHSARVGDVPEPPETDGADFGSLGRPGDIKVGLDFGE